MMVDDFFMAALDSISGISVSATSVSREILLFPMMTGKTTLTTEQVHHFGIWMWQKKIFLIETPSSRLSSKHFSQFCPHTVRLQPESKTAQFRVSPTNCLTSSLSVFWDWNKERSVFAGVLDWTSCYVSFCILGVYNTFLILSPSFSWCVISFSIPIFSIPTSSSSGTAVVHRRGFVVMLLVKHWFLFQLNCRWIVNMPRRD